MLKITVGKGRNKRQLEFPNLTRSMLHNMTELTQRQMFGEVVMKRPSDRSIHPNGKIVGRKATKRVARTRTGQEYPGGRHNRRALKKLRGRREGVYHGPHKRPDRIRSTKDIIWGEPGYKLPGSMAR